MLQDKITINKKYVDARERLIEQHPCVADMRSRMFHSFDNEHLEKQVNEFLKDVIYVKHFQRNLECDISKIEEFSGDGLTNHVVVLHYLEWPF